MRGPGRERKMGNNASHVSRIEESAGLQVPDGGDLRLASGCVWSGMLRPESECESDLVWGTVSGQCPASKDDLCWSLIDTDIGFIKRKFFLFTGCEH